jgi:hypothetical protein
MVMVMAIMTTLMVAGISLLGDTGSKSRRAATDTLSGMIEQGRSQAITGHSQVLLAVAEPGDLPTDDDRCRLGLFKLTEFDKKTGKGKGELLRRWEVINPGVALIGGDAEQFRNVMDEPAVSITYDAGGKSFDLNVHGLVFSQRGGRDWPEGSGSVVMRVAEGGYRGSGKKASANTRGASQTISEDRLKIGRLVARPHSFDP